MKLEPAGTSGQPEAASQAAPNLTRRRCFRLLALGLPLLLLLVLEAALRLAGYGYRTAFFLKAEHKGSVVLVENPKFGWRFFPPAIARAPLPLVVQSKKPPGTIRIVVFGESAAMGDPEPAFGFGRQLQRLLQARHPENRIEVINVAMTAINSHVMRVIAHDCAALQGDLWLIYAGNNEVVGPFGAGTVFGPQAPGIAVVRAALAFKATRLGQWLTSLGSRARAPRQWEGMEFFLHNQVPASDPRLKRVYANFSQNLSAVVREGQKAGAKVLLATVAVNLKDCPPFGSAHRPGLNPGEQEKWQALFDQGSQAESAGRFSQALADYQQAALLDPTFAELIFRQAQCELALDRVPAAQSDFSVARDLDTLRFRADSRLNDIVRQVASARKVPLLDVEEQIARQCPQSVPGADRFYDHVHLNFDGNYRVAKLCVAPIEQELFPHSSPAGTILPESEVAQRLAFTEFDQHRVGEEMRARLRQPPFSAQSNFEERDRRWQQTLATAQPSPSGLVWEYHAALALAPADWMLRADFAQLLEAADDKKGAMEQWGQVSEEIPQEPEAYFHLGNLALDAGAGSRAAAEFKQALQRRPNSTEALNGLGLALVSQGRTNEALAQFRAALQIDPGYSAARVNRALLLANSGDVSGAISEYRSVLRTDTNAVAARIDLAKLLFREGQKAEAFSLYNQALAIQPDNPVAQFDLGNALAAENRHAEALTHYAAAVQFQPSFADAQYDLALELARAGQVSQALPHFAEAARLMPNSAEPHFNYGVALAKLGRFDQAVELFEQTLKLKPDHAAASAMLQRARQLSAKNRLLP